MLENFPSKWFLSSLEHKVELLVELTKQGIQELKKINIPADIPDFEGGALAAERNAHS